MNGVEAVYFDGRSSTGREIRIHNDGQGGLSFEGDDIQVRYAFNEVRISTRLGDSPRYFYLPDGGKCESPANDAIDTLITSFGARHRGAWLHILESRWSWVVLAAGFTLAFLWASFEYGLPYLANKTARALPIEMENSLGEQTLQSMDRLYLKPSRLTEVQRERVRRLFRQITTRLDLPITPRLQLRRSKVLGANAFALPSGIVVVTDAMVDLADNDGQLTGVLAHELGHVANRHVLRSILQNSAAALLAASLLGDLTSITGLAASIPTFLAQQRYSRDFEREADRYAAAYLQKAGIPVSDFAAILEKLSNEHPGSDAQQYQYLSSHPATRERIAALKKILNTQTAVPGMPGPSSTIVTPVRAGRCPGADPGQSRILDHPGKHGVLGQ